MKIINNKRTVMKTGTVFNVETINDGAMFKFKHYGTFGII